MNKKVMVWLCPVDPKEVWVEPMYPKQIPEKDLHVTLAFGVDASEWQHLDGTTYKVTLDSVCANERIQAIRCTLHGIESKNAHPHITVSMIPEAKPVESNDMLAKEHMVVSAMNHDITCILKIVPLK